MLKEKLKMQIIVYIIDKDMDKARLGLRTLAKFYHVQIKVKPKKSLKEMLKQFIMNEKGYKETIPNLYHAL